MLLVELATVDVWHGKHKTCIPRRQLSALHFCVSVGVVSVERAVVVLVIDRDEEEDEEEG